MFNVGLFIKEMTRKDESGEFSMAMKELWPLCFDIFHLVTEIDNPIVLTDPSINEIKAANINHVPISRTREILLDVENPTWRAAASGKPRSFIWRGENNFLQLYPPPDDTYILWLLVQRVPLTHFPKWFNLISALRAVEMLAVGDQLVGRTQLVQFMEGWRKAFHGSLKGTIHD